MFKKLHDGGLTIIPLNGKRPKIGWQKYITQRPTDEEFATFDFSQGGGLVAKDGIFCLDLDKKYDKLGLIEKWKAKVKKEKPGLLEKLYWQKTFSGGQHAVGIADQKDGNQVLCGNKDRTAVIETRGVGGQFVIAPSQGYKEQKGSLLSLPRLSEGEYHYLLNSARCYNQFIKPEKPYSAKGDGPWVEYDQEHGADTIIELLLESGWRQTSKQGNITYFVRPGKAENDQSASVNWIPDRLYVFSTSSDFPANEPIRPSAVLAKVRFGDNWAKLAEYLKANGYGEQKRKEIKTTPLGETAKQLLDIKHGNVDKGVTTGWESLNNYYRISNFQLNIISGIPTHGKSAWVDNLAVNLASLHGWRFLMFSPESYPVQFHKGYLSEKYLQTGVVYSSDDNLKNKSSNFIDKHFIFVDCSQDDITLDQILELAKKEKVNGLIIDPWNELEYARPKGMSETDYIGYSLKKTRTFCRNNNISTWIVVHPQKQYKDEKGKYRVPTLYDCSGSANWYNKADNGIVIYRTEEDDTEVHVDKIKFRQYGQKGVVNLQYQVGWTGFTDIVTQEVRDEWDNKRMK